MKIKFKLNVEDIATYCHMGSDIDGGYARFRKISIIGMSIYIFINSIYMYNSYSFKSFLYVLIGMFLIFASFIYLSQSPKFIRIRMIRLAKSNIKQTPQLLDLQTIEIDDTHITHTQLNSSTKTGLEHIENIVTRNEIIFIFDNTGCICAAIPNSAFETSEEKEIFLNLLKKT